MPGSDPRPERSPLNEISKTDALFWLNDRRNAIVSASIGMAGENPADQLLLIGDCELQHAGDRETPEYLAQQADDRLAGSYRLGVRTLLNLRAPAADGYTYRANNLHLVIELDSSVRLRISGRKSD